MITSTNAKLTVADYLRATVELDHEGVLRTVPDGLPVGVVELTHDELGDPLTAVLRIETGDRPDDWTVAVLDLSEFASTDPDAQLVDAMAEYDRATAAALTDEAYEILRAMAGDWVHDLDVAVRTAQDFECSGDFRGGRGFEIVAALSGDDLEPDQWPNLVGDDTIGRPLTAEHVAEIAAQALDLESRILDAWADQDRDDDSEVEGLVVFQDVAWDGRSVQWVSASADDADEDWPSVGVTVTLHEAGRDITATVWDGPQPTDEFDAAGMTPRTALREALERLLDRNLPDTEAGSGALARWSREVAALDA